MKLSAIGFAIGIVAGGFIGLLSVLFYNQPPPVVTSSSDVGRLLAKLRPFTDASDSITASDESIDFFGDGSVWITLKDGGNETDGHGPSFSAAVRNLRSRSSAIAATLK